ncbi:MAG: hypothetical protein H6999_11620 [Hahellaceae bacterium]|nr:hypothetical protein [Hahellaceae bacterium]MCP5170388.1 hypothetical protein [Hahellaceae bacterium]
MKLYAGKPLYFAVLCPAALMLSLSCRADFSGTLDQEWAYGTAGTHESQKFESIIEPEWREFWGESSITARARLRADTVGSLGAEKRRPINYSKMNGPVYNDAHAELTLRELYIDGAMESHGAIPEMTWRMGKQQVVWGQADGLKVLDVVNPQSYREFILDQFDDSRIPLWMLNVSWIFDNSSSLQVLWVPDTSVHELAEVGSTYQMTTPLLVPRLRLAPGQQVQVDTDHSPSNAFEDSDAGFRYSIFWRGWDLTLNYFYHYQDTPAIYQIATPSGAILRPEYKRDHLFGGTASNAMGDFTLRTEFGYHSDSYFLADSPASGGIQNSPEIASVIGLDWQGLSDTLISVQWFQSYLLKSDLSTQRHQTEHTLTGLARRNFQNDTWEAQVLVLHAITQHDGLVRPKVTHALLSQLDVWIAADLFYGRTKGLYGQFDHNDRILLGFELGF